MLFTALIRSVGQEPAGGGAMVFNTSSVSANPTNRMIAAPRTAIHAVSNAWSKADNKRRTQLGALGAVAVVGLWVLKRKLFGGGGGGGRQRGRGGRGDDSEWLEQPWRRRWAAAPCDPTRCAPVCPVLRRVVAPPSCWCGGLRPRAGRRLLSSATRSRGSRGLGGRLLDERTSAERTAIRFLAACQVRGFAAESTGRTAGRGRTRRPSATSARATTAPASPLGRGSAGRAAARAAQRRPAAARLAAGSFAPGATGQRARARGLRARGAGARARRGWRRAVPLLRALCLRAASRVAGAAM
jgi:hypothetical protein